MSGDKKTADKAPEDTPKEDPPKPTDTGTEPDEGKLRAIIRNILEDLTGGDKPAKKDDPADVAAQVRAELENVRKGESADAERRAILDRLTKLETAAKPESAPVLFRRIEKMMGWRLPDE